MVKDKWINNIYKRDKNPLNSILYSTNPMWALWMNNNISKGWNCGSNADSGLASSSVWTQLTLTPGCPTLQTHAPNSQVIAPFLHVDPWKRIRIVWDLGIYSSSRFHYIQPGLYFNGSLFISTILYIWKHNFDHR